MSNFNINLNLKALKNAAVIDVKGKTSTKQGIFIPIEDNNLFVGEKGVYLNLSAWESDKLRDDKTHLIKQSFSKEFRAKMTDEEIKSQSILGDAKPFEMKTSVAKSESAVNASEYDDLPF